MVYLEQNDIRSMSKRLEWVLKESHPGHSPTVWRPKTGKKRSWMR